MIKLEQQLEARIVDVYTKLELVTKTKKDTISHFIFYCLGIVGVFIVANLLSASETSIRGYSMSPFVIFLVICFAAVAIGPINKYRRDYKIAKKQQEELDELLKIYKLDYKVSVKIINEAHGDFDVEKEIKIFRVG
ncbi:hypothetical protein [uncultured Kordia sp.]|uniref:hypothetical protein n=1 Tax=uncultured Kordia sp. TaxID=507699 RepID=UPI002629A0AA|nr:hypothetical protein [uncultured Kordia sp.]